MSSASSLDAEVAALAADVTAETTVSNSAIALLNGIAAQIAAGVAAAEAGDLTQLQALGPAITANTTALAAAVAANTSSAAPPPPAP